MNSPPPECPLNSESVGDGGVVENVRSRFVIYGLITTGTVAIAGFDPQLESLKSYLKPIGFVGSIGFALGGLSHLIFSYRQNRPGCDES